MVSEESFDDDLNACDDNDNDKDPLDMDDLDLDHDRPRKIRRYVFYSKFPISLSHIKNILRLCLMSEKMESFYFTLYW